MKTTKQATLSDDLFQGCIVAKPSPSHMSQHIKKKSTPIQGLVLAHLWTVIQESSSVV